MHAYMQTYTQTHIQTYIHTHIHPYIQPYIHTYIHTHTHPSIHTSTYMDARTHVRTEAEVLEVGIGEEVSVRVHEVATVGHGALGRIEGVLAARRAALARWHRAHVRK